MIQNLISKIPQSFANIFFRHTSLDIIWNCLEYQRQYINVPDHIMKHISIKKIGKWTALISTSEQIKQFDYGSDPMKKAK